MHGKITCLYIEGMAYIGKVAFATIASVSFIANYRIFAPKNAMLTTELRDYLLTYFSESTEVHNYPLYVNGIAVSEITDTQKQTLLRMCNEG